PALVAAEDAWSDPRLEWSLERSGGCYYFRRDGCHVRLDCCCHSGCYCRPGCCGHYCLPGHGRGNHGNGSDGCYFRPGHHCPGCCGYSPSHSCRSYMTLPLPAHSVRTGPSRQVPGKQAKPLHLKRFPAPPQVDPPFGLPYGDGYGIHSFFKDSSLLHRLTEILELLGICAEYWQTRISNFNALHTQSFFCKCYASKTGLLLRQRDKSLCVNFPSTVDITAVKGIPQFRQLTWSGMTNNRNKSGCAN